MARLVPSLTMAYTERRESVLASAESLSNWMPTAPSSCQGWYRCIALAAAAAGRRARAVTAVVVETVVSKHLPPCVPSAASIGACVVPTGFQNCIPSPCSSTSPCRRSGVSLPGEAPGAVGGAMADAVAAAGTFAAACDRRSGAVDHDRGVGALLTVAGVSLGVLQPVSAILQLPWACCRRSKGTSSSTAGCRRH